MGKVQNEYLGESSSASQRGNLYFRSRTDADFRSPIALYLTFQQSFLNVALE